MKTAMLIFTFLLCNAMAIGQHTNSKLKNKGLKYNDSKSSIIALVKSKKIPGKLYGSKSVILILISKDEAADYLIDSTFNFEFLNSNKISFYIQFNEAASNIKYGYAEIILKPYSSKMIFLNAHIDSINQVTSRDYLTQTVYTKSVVRYGSLTLTDFRIKSYLNEKQGRFFTYTKIDKIRDVEQ